MTLLPAAKVDRDSVWNGYEVAAICRHKTISIWVSYASSEKLCKSQVRKIKDS
jgi:hypothetical protein